MHYEAHWIVTHLDPNANTSQTRRVLSISFPREEKKNTHARRERTKEKKEEKEKRGEIPLTFRLDVRSRAPNLLSDSQPR